MVTTQRQVSRVSSGSRRLSLAERHEQGKAARGSLPRDAHAVFDPPADRPDPVSLRHYGELCGWTLARAHARSGDRIAIAAYLGGSDVFDRAIADFASAYADQNERDHAALAEAAASGRIAATSDV
jgi:hypothetical protein